MKPPSISRRRLLIGLGLLGLGSIFYPPAHRFMEIRKGARTWTKKWREPADDQPTATRSPPPDHARRVPTLVENDLTLSKTDSPWLIDNNVMIAAGATLTIEAGSEIFICRKCYITVYGKIHAQGDTENPIHLRAYSGAETDKWAGILIIQSGIPSVFRHVVFGNSYYGARLVYGAATWTACTFINVREVISAFKSETLFKDCLVDYKDYAGHGNINVFKFQKGSVLMEDCVIYNPDSDYKVDGIDANRLESGIFRGNQLYGGKCPGADAFDIGEDSKNILIENNIITDFVDKGISVGERSDITANNNIIARCAIGAGIKDSAHAKITRTTFYGNDHAIRCYEKVPGQGGGHAILDKCILAASRVAPFEVDKKSTLRFTNSLCDQQQLPGKGNLQGTPVFEDIGKDRFNCIRIIRTGSPADTGTLPATSMGAHIDPYPTRLPTRTHAKSNLDST